MRYLSHPSSHTHTHKQRVEIFARLRPKLMGRFFFCSLPLGKLRFGEDNRAMLLGTMQRGKFAPGKVACVCGFCRVCAHEWNSRVDYLSFFEAWWRRKKLHPMQLIRKGCLHIGFQRRRSFWKFELKVIVELNLFFNIFIWMLYWCLNI